MKHTDFKSVEDCLKYKGINSDELDAHFAWMPEHRRVHSKMQFILETVVECINGGWVVDWSNTKQKKWYVFFSISSSGFGFSYACYDCEAADTSVGSRLVFESEEKAAYAAKIFIKLYEEYFYAKYGAVSSKSNNLNGKIAEIDGVKYELTIIE